jgi:hypothetical protein
MILMYRAIEKDLVLLDIRSGVSTLVCQRVRFAHIESIARDDGGPLLAGWRSAADGEQRFLALTLMDLSGVVVRKERFPEGRAMSTVEGTAPMIIRENGSDGDCLAIVADSELTDVYCPDRVILAAKGSPTADAVAVLEEKPDSPHPAAECNLRVLSSDGWRPVTVAEDAYGLSRVAWSPDGARMAYARAEDGRIAVIAVPPLE